MKKITTILTLLVFTSIFSQIPSYVPTNGLVGYFPFNGNANDESINSNNGTVNGATLISDRFGNPNNAYYFSSINCSTYINANVNTSSITSSVTISFWMFKQGNGCQNTRIWEFCPGPAGSVPSAIEAYWYNNTIAGIDHVTSNGSFVGTVTSSTLNLNQWYNVVYTNDGSTAKIYLNGNLVNNYVSSGNPIIASNLTIGRMGHASYDAFNGKIDDFGIWNRALTQEEITSLYLADTTCQSLVINTGILSFNPVTYNNTVTIYPNPANDHITIDCGNLANVTGFQIKIVNTLGQDVFSGAMNTQQYVVPLNTWSGTGVYFVKIYDASNNLLNTKKIILQ
jgi:hypothetical protein